MKRSTLLGWLMAGQAACALFSLYLCEVGHGSWLSPIVILLGSGFFADMARTRRDAIQAERGWRP